MATANKRQSRLDPSKAPVPRPQPTYCVGKISRWGNTLGVRIPQEAVEQLNLKDGDCAHFEFVGDGIAIRCAKPRRKYSEAQLLKGITPAMCGTDLLALRSDDPS
jgi:antitoxin MazE